MRGFAPTPNHQERGKERFRGLQLLAGRKIPAAVSALRAERQPLSKGQILPCQGQRAGAPAGPVCSQCERHSQSFLLSPQPQSQRAWGPEVRSASRISWGQDQEDRPSGPAHRVLDFSEQRG